MDGALVPAGGARIIRRETREEELSDTAKRLFGERARFYVKSDVHKDPVNLGRVVELARPEPHHEALDTATGPGHVAYALAPHVALVTGVDLAMPMVDEVLRQGREKGVGRVVFALADALALPFGYGSFDIVTCRRAAHHFTDIATALLEMRRVLKTGGRLVIDDRCAPADPFLDESSNRLDRLRDPSHVRQYSEDEWRWFLAELGFVLEVVEPYVLHRPLTTLTENAPPASVGEIERIIASLSPEQRRAFGLRETDGEMRINHWYITVAAQKR